MRNFIIKSSLFVLPFFMMFIFNLFFLKFNQGDLTRLGFIYNDACEKTFINKSFFKLPKKYELISSLNLNKQQYFSLLTIGDSFSEQGLLGYQNYLANKENISVVHVERFLSVSQAQTLVSMINGDFFDNINVDYVVLQSIERAFMSVCKNIDFKKKTNLQSFADRIARKNKKNDTQKNFYKMKFFSTATVMAPFTNIMYNFFPKPFGSKTYKVDVTERFFCNSVDNLLFYYEDVKNLNINNDDSQLKHANDVLNNIANKLAEKNIKLIVLISPDKYDLYYPYILNKNDFKEPLFFEKFNRLPKEYIYINSKDVLRENIHIYKNLYYYDDTHWSPIAAQIIAKEIASKIENQ